MVKSNIVFHTRPFIGFSDRRSFFVFGLKFERSEALEENLEKLRQEYEDAKVKAEQYGNQVTRLRNRLELCRNIVIRQEVCDKIREVRITEGMNGYGRKNQNDASITQ